MSVRNQESFLPVVKLTVNDALADMVLAPCVTQIYRTNPAADSSDCVEQFELTPMEFETIKGFTREGDR